MCPAERSNLRANLIAHTTREKQWIEISRRLMIILNNRNRWEVSIFHFCREFDDADYQTGWSLELGIHSWRGYVWSWTDSSTWAYPVWWATSSTCIKGVVTFVCSWKPFPGRSSSPISIKFECWHEWSGLDLGTLDSKTDAAHTACPPGQVLTKRTT